jgi:predicted permease
MPRFWRLFSRGDREREIENELAAHVAHKRDALVRDGLSEAEAGRRARIAFGNASVWREETRGVWSLVWLEGLLQDIRFGLRTLAKDRLFAFVAVATLALGFGATTAVFSLIDGLLLRALPVPEAERLAEVHTTNLPPDIVQWVNGRKVAAREMRGASYGVMQALAADPAVGGVLGIAGNGRSAIEANGNAMLATTVTVSGGFFDTLRLSPAAGRFFTVADDVRGGPPGGWPVVLSHSGWTRLFQKSPAAVGSVVKIERQPFVVAGIAPPSFSGVNRGLDPEIYLPFHAMEAMYGGFRWDGSRQVAQIVVRLAPGITFESARDEILARSPKLFSAGGLPEAASREKYLAQKIELRRVSAASSRAGRTYGQALWLLLAAVGAVLLIAATNLANLSLARAMRRGPEFAVRMALGAPASRVRRQVLIEALLISTAGAASGAVLVWWLPPAIVRLFSTSANSIHVDTTPDWTIALFAAALLIATTFVAGWAPATVSSRTTPNRLLKASSRVSKSVRGRAALIALQTALTLVLLMGTSLLAASLRELWREGIGMDGANTAFCLPDLYNAGIDRKHMGRVYENILRGTRELPGVESASWTLTIPMTGSMQAFQVTAAGRPSAPEMSNLTFRHQVSDGYFRSVGLPLIAGVDFPAGATGRRNTCVLSESAAIRLFGSAGEAVGRVVVPGKLPPAEVIGVSGDAKYIHLREPSPPTIYTPYWSEEVRPGMTLVVRAAGSKGQAAATTAAINKLFRDEAGRMPHVRFETAESLRAALTAQERALTWLLGGLGAIALLISATGIAGLLAYSVEQRRKEIGVRLALGAPPRSIRRSFAFRAMGWVAAGIALGMAAAWPLRRVLDSFLFRTSTADWHVWAAAVIVLLAVAAAASYGPALRASRTNILDALRVD